MADFSDFSSKLGGPPKKSLFERQKAEAEAKKAKEKAETAAVLEDFVKSFDDEPIRAPPQTFGRAAGGHAGPGKRHFTSSGLKSGPGSLGPASTIKSGPGSLGAAFNRKRQYDDYSDRRDKGGVFSYRDDKKSAFDEEDRETEKAAAKPTLHLASLPPGTSPAIVKSLLASSPLVVENVRLLPPATPVGPSTERRSTSAIVTLAAETAATDIDTAVSHLQNKYLGFGFRLSISRHLSSAALGNINISTNSATSLPFGAKALPQRSGLSRAPPPNQRFAPPTSYTSPAPYGRGIPTQVTVQPPSDLKQLKLIHKLLEALLTYGPEFEALLMSRPEIQKDEMWAWLWDSRSPGGVYYRWRLWEILTDASSRRRRRGNHPETIFSGQSSWLPPDESLRFEYTTKLEDFVSDEDYNSSDEEDDEGGLAKRYNDHNIGGAPNEEVSDGMGYLDPLAKAKLVHLLSRLPDSSAKLRRGDVARITGFAIEHAGAGPDEIAMLVCRNVVQPFRHGEDDTTSASLVGLYVISDILSSSASAGVRHAWRYRTLFEAALRKQKVFEKLGRAEKDLSWGKLKAEKWKRSIQTLLDLWEGWSVFPHAAHEEFTKVFLSPPLTEEERKAVELDEQRKDDDAKRSKSTSKWKSVEEEAVAADAAMQDVDEDDLDGSPMEEDLDENIDGVSMADSSDEEGPATEDVQRETKTEVPKDEKPVSREQAKGSTPLKRQRPRAVDMFADESE